MVSRHEGCLQVLRDAETFSSLLGYGGMMQPERVAGALAGRATSREVLDSGMGMLMRGMAGLRILIATDPPDRTRLRRLVSRPFAPRNIWALQPHIGDISRLRTDPVLLKPAVEEALRYDSPVEGFWRGTTRPATVRGTEISADARVMAMFASANRDEEHWGADAGAFRIDRNPSDHIAFGTGVHVCLGRALARLEARVAVELLLSRTRGLESAGEPTPTRSPVLRGVTAQPVAVAAA
jgi:cytochrome P450